MGGGSGGYNRPSGGSGSERGSGESDEEKPSHVPPPESDPEEETTEDPADDSSESTNEETSEGSHPTGGSDGTLITGPREDTNDTSEGDNSETGDAETPENESSDEGDSGHSDEKSDGQNSTKSNSKNGEKDNQGNETDDEDTEDDEQEEEDDDEDDEEEDECLITESALLHSPNPEPLGDATEGDIGSVRLREKSVCVVDAQGRTIGAIAEPWVGTLKECIEQGRQYRTRILDIDSGKCEVRITNKCLLKQSVTLSSVNTEVQNQLYRGLSLSVEATTEGVAVVMADGSTVSIVPNPWSQLLNECLDQGRSYKATVRNVAPDSCTVDIQNGSIEE